MAIIERGESSSKFSPITFESFESYLQNIDYSEIDDDEEGYTSTSSIMSASENLNSIHIESIALAETHVSVLSTPKAADDSSEYIPTCDPSLIPTLEMRFDTVEKGIQFYDNYAKASGFTARLSSTRRYPNGVLHRRYIVCNKQGQSVSKAANDQKRLLSRVGCRACIVLKLCPIKGDFYVLEFHEGHNHALTTPKTQLHLKDSRHVNILHKKMILDNSRVNQGPVRTFRMIKEYVRGYRYIGASLEDFKNFMRDVKLYIKNFDGQMIVEKFMRLKTMWSSFFFDFDVDADGNLSRLFWADPVCRKNYALFGDAVSFDTTFDMNKYKMVFTPFTGMDNHKRCITFAAGFIAKEDIESFTWLFKNFLTAMGNCHPKVLITDQDPAMKVAIPQVFDMNKTRHRLCMWHIMKKVNDKVDVSIRKNTPFLNELCACVWSNDLEPLEFDRKLNSIMAEYDLTSNEWLTHMFDIRKSWIPAYYKGMRMAGIMRTTSLSESENNFFGHFTNPHLTLVEFWMRFESAMDAQRWSESKLHAASKNTFPKLVTELPLEKHASEFYTPTVFYEIQEELKAACYSCGIASIQKDELSIEVIMVHDYKLSKSYKVGFLAEPTKVKCYCKMFERVGYLCRHALCVLKERGVTRIPSLYLLNRWSKAAASEPMYQFEPTILQDCTQMDDRNKKIGDLWSEIFTCVALAEKKEDHIDKLLDILKTFKDGLNVDAATEGNQDKRNEMSTLIGFEVPAEVTILPPKQSNNKGTRKRLLSDKEKAVQQRKRAPRECKACGEIGYHDSRNCPGKPT